jgi:hypothetical protein
MGMKTRASASDTLKPNVATNKPHSNNPAAGHAGVAALGISTDFISPISSAPVRSQAKLAIELPKKSGCRTPHQGGSRKVNVTKNPSNDASSKDHGGDGNRNSLSRKANGAKRGVQQQDETLESLREKYELLKTSYEVECAKSKQLTKDRNLRKKGATALRKEVKAYQEKTKNEHKASKDLQGRLVDELEQTKEALFSRIGKGATGALDDNFLQGKLEEIRMSWQNWVSENAVPSLDGIGKEYIESLLSRAMPQPLRPHETQQLYQLFTQDPGAPRMLLGILVSYSAYEPLLQDPFAFLGDQDHQERAVLERILDHGMLSK